MTDQLGDGKIVENESSMKIFFFSSAKQLRKKKILKNHLLANERGSAESSWGLSTSIIAEVQWLFSFTLYTIINQNKTSESEWTQQKKNQTQFYILSARLKIEKRFRVNETLQYKPKLRTWKVSEWWVWSQGKREKELQRGLREWRKYNRQYIPDGWWRWWWNSDDWKAGTFELLAKEETSSLSLEKKNTRIYDGMGTERHRPNSFSF